MQGSTEQSTVLNQETMRFLAKTTNCAKIPSLLSIFISLFKDRLMAQILAIGNLVLDTVLPLDHFPAENEEMRVMSRQHQLGGNACNSLYVLNQLGHQADLVTTLASDAPSKQLQKGLSARGIGQKNIQKLIQGQTPTSYIWLNQMTGSRTISHYRDLAEVSFDHFAKIEIEAYDWLHFEGRNLTHLPGMLNIAKTFLSHQPISLEVEKARPGIEALFPQANLLIFSHHYAQQIGINDGQALIAAMQSLAPQAYLVCTWGEKGAWFAAPKGTIKHQPAEKIHPIDTLGAGDVFNAGLIHSLLDTPDLAQAVQFASTLAAKKCQQSGLDDLLSAQQAPQPLANIKQISNAKTLVVPSPTLGREVVLIKFEDQIRAYLNDCPHQNVPLNEAFKIDVNPFEKTMKCSVHEAWFTIEDGECITGPCLGDHLTPVAVRLDETGNIYLIDS